MRLACPADARLSTMHRAAFWKCGSSGVVVHNGVREDLSIDLPHASNGRFSAK